MVVVVVVGTSPRPCAFNEEEVAKEEAEEEEEEEEGRFNTLVHTTHRIESITRPSPSPFSLSLPLSLSLSSL